MNKCIYSIALGILLIGFSAGAKADGISYTLTDLGSGNWLYSYTVTNTSVASGLYVFDIYFPSVFSTDSANYSNLMESANPDPSNWSTTIFPPSAPNLGGFYDALALTTPIAEGQSLAGFSVQFSYSGTSPLGSQYFEFYDTNYNLLQSGATAAATPAIPEPSTLILVVSGVLGLLGLGLWPRK